MSEVINGGLAYVIPSADGGNYVRKTYDPNADILGVIPECAVLAVLLDDGVSQREIGKHIWVKVRSRTDDKRNGRYKIVEGWTAASENGIPFLGSISTHYACNDTAMGTPLDTHLKMDRMAYVLKPVLDVYRNFRDPNPVGQFHEGTIVTLKSEPMCGAKSVWWQVEPLGAPGRLGWVTESFILDPKLQWHLGLLPAK